MAKKRTRRSRLRGRKTCGYGSRKKHRGSGNRGGKGMAGTGKRADHRKTWILKYMPDYFGKHGFKSIKQIKVAKADVINLDAIEKRLNTFLEKGIAKKTPQGIEINLQEYKVLGAGDVHNKFIIKAKAFSSQAAKKIEKAGGKIERIGRIEKVKEKAEEKGEEKAEEKGKQEAKKEETLPKEKEIKKEKL